MAEIGLVASLISGVTVVDIEVAEMDGGGLGAM